MKTFPTVSLLELECQSDWLTIWFNQPEKRNPLTDAMRLELLAVLQAARQDTAIRGISMRGRGGFFCAGGDLRSFRSLADSQTDRKAAVQTSRDIGELLELVNRMPQVVLALVEGAAIAGGFGLACCADAVICEKSAKFALTETAIGLSPAQIAPYVIQKLGFATARRLMLTAARFDGAAALNYGFADELVDGASELTAAETQIKNQVLACAPGAIADTKSLILLLNDCAVEERIGIAAENFADRMASDESREGIDAFFEKRKPAWAG